MIKDDEKLVVYLKASVNSVFKILPLWEEENVGVKIYIESLLSELESLNEALCSLARVSGNKLAHAKKTIAA